MSNVLLDGKEKKILKKFGGAKGGVFLDGKKIVSKFRGAKGGVFLDGKKINILKKFSDGQGLLEILGVSPQEAIMKLDGKVMPFESEVGKAKKIEVIRVVFGG